MNKINPTKINTIVNEVGNKKDVIKETVQKTVREVKTQTSNLGRDLVKGGGNEPSRILISDLLKDGYVFGEAGIVYKMDHKKDIYKAVQFENGNATNITMQKTILGEKVVISQKLDDNTWVTLTDYGKNHTYIKGDTSEKAIQKATELQFNGYEIVAQDEKALTFSKDDVSVVISKANGKEIK